jgi:hypothetical protein
LFKMRMKCPILILTILTVFILASTLVVVATPAQVDGNYIEAEGWGVAPDNERNPGRGRLMARRAAVVDAYRNLGEQIESVRVTAETTVADSMVVSDVIKTNMEALIKGASVVNEDFYPDGTYRVKMRLPKFGEQSIASAIFAADRGVAPTPFPTVNIQDISPPPVVPSVGTTPAVVSPPQIHGAYTGIIIDCSGLGLQSVMSPVIADASGRAIYGHKNLDPDYIIKHGMVDYVQPGGSLARAGNNPLTVRAIRLESNNGKPIISVEDANVILIENQTAKFLDRTAVVFRR